jgi:hypothetical protein
MDSKMFHQRARDCLRLADECPDLYAREALMELADEFKHMATQLDTDVRTRSRHAREYAAAHRQPSPR